MKCRHIWASSAVRALVSRLNGYSSRSLFVQVPVDVFDGVLRSRVWAFLEADGVQWCSRLVSARYFQSRKPGSIAGDADRESQVHAVRGAPEMYRD